jgi:hypothetical protein
MTTRTPKRTRTKAVAGRRPGGGRASRRGKEAPGSVAARVPALTAKQVEAAKRKYEESILARGEAAPAGAPLPPGATHEIVGHTLDGRPVLRRRRFSTT